LVSLFYLAHSSQCTKDWFVANSPITCPLPRIRRAFGDLTYETRKVYVRVVYQMKLHKDKYLTGSTASYSLYDIFQQIHSSSRNSMFHGTSAFPPQHKGLLWLYESALNYIAAVDGPSMDPPITADQACIAQPYWKWDDGWNSALNDWSNMANTDVFWDSDLFGDTHPAASSYKITTGLFRTGLPWKMYSSICAPGNSYCDTDLKRLFNQAALTTTLPNIKSYLTLCDYSNFLVYIHGGMHGMIHNYISFAMLTTGTSAMDPLFWLHHANIDRFYHLWADCCGHETVPASQLTDNCPQYAAINPIGSGASKKDPYPPQNAWPVTIDSILNYYTSSTTATFLQPSDWPTIRDMWSMGDTNNYGWCGLYYRYGPDTLVSSLTCPDTTWRWVNYTPPVK